MPDYRMKTRLTDDPEVFGSEITALVQHAQPYAAVLSNPRFVAGYFTITCDKTLPVAIRNHLNIEVAP